MENSQVTDERLQEMIIGMKPYAKARYGIKINEFSSKDIYSAMCELKDRRESALRPADKYLINTAGRQFEHIKSEMDEVEKAINEQYQPNLTSSEQIMRKRHLAEELIDLQMSCETMLTILGLDEQGRMKSRRMVIAKNDARHYYEAR